MAKPFDIVGNFPSKAEDKRPTLICKGKYSTILHPPNNVFTFNNTLMMVMTDTFTLNICELGSGGIFASLGIHPGDESYYILNGLVVQRSGNGQPAYPGTGEGLFMSEGAWYCCHDFSDQRARVLYSITPKAWSESIPPAVTPSDEEMRFYKGLDNDTLLDIRGKIQDTSRQGCTDDIDVWPVDPKEARETGAVYVARGFEELNNVHGVRRPMLMRFITSNDYGHFGEFIPPAGGYGLRCSDPDTYEGDAALYCIEGPVTANLVDPGESSVLEPEDTFFVPSGVEYQLMDFEDHPVKTAFIITKL